MLDEASALHILTGKLLLIRAFLMNSQRKQQLPVRGNPLLWIIWYQSKLELRLPHINNQSSPTGLGWDYAGMWGRSLQQISISTKMEKMCRWDGGDGIVRDMYTWHVTLSVTWDGVSGLMATFLLQPYLNISIASTRKLSNFLCWVLVTITQHNPIMMYWNW